MASLLSAPHLEWKSAGPAVPGFTIAPLLQEVCLVEGFVVLGTRSKQSLLAVVRFASEKRTRARDRAMSRDIDSP